MTKSKTRMLLVMVLTIFTLPFALAQNWGESFRPILNIFTYFFMELPIGESRFVFLKFLLWVLFYSLLSIILKKLPFMQKADATDQKRGNFIAIILALMMSLLMPNGFLDYIFITYTLTAAIILSLALAGLLMWTTTQLPDSNLGRVIKGVIFLIAAMMVMLTTGSLALTFGPAFQGAADWLGFLQVVLLSMGLYFLFTGMFSGLGQGVGGVAGGGTVPQAPAVQAPEVTPVPAGLPADQQEYMGEVRTFGANVQNYNAMVNQFRSDVDAQHVRTTPYNQTQQQNIINLANSLLEQGDHIFRHANTMLANIQRFNAMPQADQDAFWQYYAMYLGSLQNVLHSIDRALALF